MKNSVNYQTNKKLVGGPAWADELLGRLKTDQRFAMTLKGISHWANLPISTRLPELPRWGASDVGDVQGFLSSGSRGEPKLIYFSAQDWHELVSYRAQCLTAVGVTAATKAIVVVPFGPWFSGDNLTAALRSLGSSVLSVGAYAPHFPSAIALMHQLAKDTLVTLPSTALTLIRLTEQARQSGLVPNDFALKRTILVGERASATLRQTIEHYLGGTTHMLFAASEAVIGYEDPQYRGLYHWNPEWLHLEVLQDDGQVAEAGEGALLVTRRGGEAMPVVRYALGDRVVLYPTGGGQLGSFAFLGRQGQAFQLPAGVQVDFQLLEAFLDDLRPEVGILRFYVHHRKDGTTHLEIGLDRMPASMNHSEVAARFAAMSLDITHVMSSGFLSIQTVVLPQSNLGGKAIQVRETNPWP